MKILSIKEVGTDFEYSWPKQQKEVFEHYIEYIGLFEQGEFVIRIGYTIRNAYGRDRKRVVIWINGYPFAEFVGTDNFEYTGEVISEIKLKHNKTRLMCCYPKDPVPPRYAMFNVQGIPTRVSGKYVHHAWGVVANIADHKTLISLAAMRQFEKDYFN